MASPDLARPGPPGADQQQGIESFCFFLKNKPLFFFFEKKNQKNFYSFWCACIPTALQPTERVEKPGGAKRLSAFAIHNKRKNSESNRS
jgi:hypothetical protein